MVTVGDPRQSHVNLVPRDFVVAAISRLSALEISAAASISCAIPIRRAWPSCMIFSQATGRRLIRFPLPNACQGACSGLPGVRQRTGITPESIDYFTHPTEYTCENTLGLNRQRVACPPFRDYAPVLVRFMQEHPGDRRQGHALTGRRQIRPDRCRPYFRQRRFPLRGGRPQNAWCVAA